MKSRYYTVKDEYCIDGKVYRSYGVIMAEVINEEITVLSSAHDLSKDHEKIERFVKKCNELDLSPIHFFDAVFDLLEDDREQ
ncbi:MAG: hypothetical protein IJZ89_09240 [Clostridia bacterium]|nr:hypothetical protein [Clostridia bacterium]